MLLLSVAFLTIIPTPRRLPEDGHLRVDDMTAHMQNPNSLIQESFAEMCCKIKNPFWNWNRVKLLRLLCVCGLKSFSFPHSASAIWPMRRMFAARRARRATTPRKGARGARRRRRIARRRTARSPRARRRRLRAVRTRTRTRPRPIRRARARARDGATRMKRSAARVAVAVAATATRRARARARTRGRCRRSRRARAADRARARARARKPPARLERERERKREKSSFYHRSRERMRTAHAHTRSRESPGPCLVGRDTRSFSREEKTRALTRRRRSRAALFSPPQAIAAAGCPADGPAPAASARARRLFAFCAFIRAKRDKSLARVSAEARLTFLVSECFFRLSKRENLGGGATTTVRAPAPARQEFRIPLGFESR